MLGRYWKRSILPTSTFTSLHSLQILDSVEIDLFQELLAMIRAMSIREKRLKYMKLSEEIRQDRLNATLRADRVSLQYNPSSPPLGSLSEEELKTRCDSLLEKLSERDIITN